MINALRGHLSEFGIIAATDTTKVVGLISIVRDKTDLRLPKAARHALMEIASQIDALKAQIEKLEQAIVATVRRDDDARRLVTIPGVGAIIAASVRALVPDPGGFKSGRHFAAWLGLTPKPHSSGGKERLGRISKMGNPVLRSLLVVGATAVLGHARGNPKASRWITALLSRRRLVRRTDGRWPQKPARGEVPPDDGFQRDEIGPEASGRAAGGHRAFHWRAEGLACEIAIPM